MRKRVGRFFIHVGTLSSTPALWDGMVAEQIEESASPKTFLQYRGVVTLNDPTLAFPRQERVSTVGQRLRI